MGFLDLAKNEQTKILRPFLSHNSNNNKSWNILWQAGIFFLDEVNKILSLVFIYLF